MEIISFVQDDRRKGPRIFSEIGFRKFEFSRRKRAQTLTYQNFAHGLNTFAPQKVRNSVNIRSIFRMIGSEVSLFFEFLKDNVKTVVISLFVSVVVIAVSFLGIKFFEHKMNFTNPLELQVESFDIENLNRLMENFALEGVLNVDESGNLLDSDNSLNAARHFTEPVTFQNYTVRSGDTISGIAKKFGLGNISTLISVNDIGNVRQLAAGQKLKIPSIDGVVYSVKSGDSLNSIVSKYNISLEALVDVNELSSEILQKGQQLFIPGVGLDKQTLQNAMGDMFKMPISAKFRWSSPYGSRIDPIAGVKSFHTGVDMACPTGTPIYASMSGKVITAGINRVYGNYVIIDHGNGYQTLYAHMSKIIATKGQWVSQGTRIGLVGSTGYSTGPHLHFTVYKNGKLVNPMSVLK